MAPQWHPVSSHSLRMHPARGLALRLGPIFLCMGLARGRVGLTRRNSPFGKHWAVQNVQFLLVSSSAGLRCRRGWANERSMREIYLRGFEIGFKEGGAKAAMMGYNRIGTVENAVNRALITDVLHGEWGSHAHCLTDGYATMIGCDKYENPDLQIRAGGGQLLNIMGYDGTNGLSERTTGSEKGREMMHDMCKRILYVYCNSNAMTTTRDYTPYWKYLLGGVDVLLVGGVALARWKDSRLRKAEEEEAETGQADKAKSDKA
jgi:beta-glucosidase